METKQTHMIYGLITAIALIALNLIVYVADLEDPSWTQWVNYAIFFIGVLLNAFAFSKANDQYVTFGSVFSSGFKASAIITIISIAWFLVFMMIFPEMKEKGMEIARKSMEKKQMSEEQIDQALEMTKKYYSVFTVGVLVFSYMLFGAIFSLVGAAVAKKKGNQPMVSE
jgi:uncharacterized membrane protein YciS (DUF1049 family)